ncbi:MAG: asparagine synthase (glutamine-hydrolyzing) [Candidatus Eremiobacteraeota bacterium]|nr:asparagine synthase (glutamine-hydrolyzing) [Candidatus Eremiobacteraeota bacterium]
MCGITGFYYYGENQELASREDLAAMNDTLAHRGPDEEGLFYREALGLAHRRLSIIDLSPTGRQPMECPGDQLVLILNGEIYNFMELRCELEALGHSFRGTSDTEVVLASYREWGRECLSRFIGMFSFALWDGKAEALFLARDRLGVKPLYYYHHRGHFVFASELKALLRYPFFRRELDMESLYEYLVFQYVPDPRTIYRHTRKLSPGSFLVLRRGEIEIRPYWDLSPRHEGSVDEDELQERFNALLDDSVRLRQISDVPVGAFLSGGIDSSTVVAFMQAQNSMAVKTFSIGFKESLYDEAPYAREVARCLGTDHQELYVTPRETYEVIPALARYYDEPFSDSSAIPTYLVSKMASEEVKVCLSGDGGDELMGGYNRYELMRRWKMVESMPLAKEAASLVAELPDSVLALLGRALKGLFFGRLKVRTDPDRIRELARTLGRSALDVYLGLVRIWGPEEARRLLFNGVFDLRGTMFYRYGQMWQHEGDPARCALVDLKTYLVGDILTKVDRASMAWGLEVRVPFLDHRIVEFAVSVPFSLKQKGSESKYLLKKLLYERISPELFKRPKQGFGIPISQWLRGELKFLVDEYLDAARLKREGLLDGSLVTPMVRAHEEGTADFGYRLYNLLMFQMWREKYL